MVGVKAVCLCWTCRCGAHDTTRRDQR